MSHFARPGSTLVAGPAEMRRIFASLGLTEKFWDPEGEWA
jgi:hypothetical protein